jgi:hypothetical protein
MSRPGLTGLCDALAIAVEIVGASASERSRILGWVNRAMEALEWDDDLQVRVWDPPAAPSEQEAWGGEQGVSLRPSLLRDTDVRLGYILTEEVGHVRLGALGVPHGASFASALCQELFATWFQYRLIIGSGLVDPSRMITTPVKARFLPASVAIGRDLGKHLGAALAGSPLNRRRLEAWSNDPNVDDAPKSLALGIWGNFPADAPPPVMARLVAGFYSSLTQTANE